MASHALLLVDDHQPEIRSIAEQLIGGGQTNQTGSDDGDIELMHSPRVGNRSAPTRAEVAAVAG